MELHLDISGRLSGDMFIAALLDAFPDYEEAAIEAIDAVSDAYPVDCQLQSVRDQHIRARRFVIQPYTDYFGHLEADIEEQRETWGALRQRLQAAQLPTGVRRHAMGILMQPTRKQLADREIALDSVSFVRHEAWQLMAQAVGAAAVIDGLGDAQWTARVASRDFATPIGEGILVHLGIHPQHAQARDETFRGELLRSGLGLADPAHSTGLGEVRLNCYEDLGAGAGSWAESDSASTRDRKDTRSL
jgi:uncharacterized protein (DUF111 family)